MKVLINGKAKWEMDAIAYQELKNKSGTPGRLGLLIVKHFLGPKDEVWWAKAKIGKESEQGSNCFPENLINDVESKLNFEIPFFHI